MCNSVTIASGHLETHLETPGKRMNTKNQNIIIKKKNSNMQMLKQQQQNNQETKRDGFPPCVSTASFFFVLPFVELSQLTWKKVNSRWCFSWSWVGSSILICKGKRTKFLTSHNSKRSQGRRGMPPNSNVVACSPNSS